MNCTEADHRGCVAFCFFDVPNQNGRQTLARGSKGVGKIDSTGLILEYQMNGTAVTGSGTVTSVAAEWGVVG
jgi:hypothetical protein